MARGILYIVWGDSVEADFNARSSPCEIFIRICPFTLSAGSNDPKMGFRQKTVMGSISPFETTLFLDADTVVLGNLDYAFDRAEEYGLACCICECPWLRRYGNAEGDLIEYNSGVLFFAQKAAPHFRCLA